MTDLTDPQVMLARIAALTEGRSNAEMTSVGALRAIMAGLPTEPIDPREVGAQKLTARIAMDDQPEDGDAAPLHTLDFDLAALHQRNMHDPRFRAVVQRLSAIAMAGADHGRVSGNDLLRAAAVIERDLAPNTDAAHDALMRIADQAFHTVPADQRDAVAAEVNLVLEALGRDERVMRVPR